MSRPGSDGGDFSEALATLHEIVRRLDVDRGAHALFERTVQLAELCGLHLDRVVVVLDGRTWFAVAERLVAGTEAMPGDRAERFHGDRSQPAAGRA